VAWVQATHGMQDDAVGKSMRARMHAPAVGVPQVAFPAWPSAVPLLLAQGRPPAVLLRALAGGPLRRRRMTWGYDGWMDGWMDGWVDGWVDGWI